MKVRNHYTATQNKENYKLRRLAIAQLILPLLQFACIQESRIRHFTAPERSKRKNRIHYNYASGEVNYHM